ncbi:MAG: hypothetical protein DMF61_18470 [Blastocatellia bacterium AA13]|nr:MAG: hypothetical protein DMF61_18470 [Blastocatellia bacterium AA13]
MTISFRQRPRPRFGLKEDRRYDFGNHQVGSALSADLMRPDYAGLEFSTAPRAKQRSPTYELLPNLLRHLSI